MPISFGQRVSVPADTLMNEVAGESVLLSLKSERYFGLDDVGTAMWRALTNAGSIQASYERLLTEFDVEPKRLRQDLSDFVGTLVEHELIEVQDA